jgi:hypothetical protein
MKSLSNTASTLIWTAVLATTPWARAQRFPQTEIKVDVRDPNLTLGLEKNKAFRDELVQTACKTMKGAFPFWRFTSTEGDATVSIDVNRKGERPNDWNIVVQLSPKVGSRTRPIREPLFEEGKGGNFVAAEPKRVEIFRSALERLLGSHDADKLGDVIWEMPVCTDVDFPDANASPKTLIPLAVEYPGNILALYGAHFRIYAKADGGRYEMDTFAASEKGQYRKKLKLPVGVIVVTPKGVFEYQNSLAKLDAERVLASRRAGMAP